MNRQIGAQAAPCSAASPGTAIAESPVIIWLKRHSLLVLIALVTIGSLRIVGTYTVFNHTNDEPVHIACGMEWLDQGVYRCEPLHPPLARVAAALGPFLDGGTSHGNPGRYGEGLAILSAGGHYDRTLALARLGILPFFWVACLVLYLWGKHYFDALHAILAVLIFSSLPPILAHAGLATTDMALTAMVGASFLSAVIWCERPNMASCLVFGATSGLAVLSKFSSLAFLPVSFVAALACYLLVERPGAVTVFKQARARASTLCLAVLVAFYIIWAGYRFSFGQVPFASLRLPFPELYSGVQAVIERNRASVDFAYLLGEHSDSGWWYYYFVVLGVKTPLAFFALLACGLFVAARNGASRGLWLALAFSCSILLFCLFSHINLGVRHVLPVYIGFSIAAAAGAAALLNRARQLRAAGWIGGTLLVALTATSALAHPDYLAYFNGLAGSHPERILVDSDLDWGQDVKRLGRRLRAVGATQVAFTPCLPADFGTLGLPPLAPSDFLHPSPGWNAMRLTVLELMIANKRSKDPGRHFWAEDLKPEEKIGKSILLWYFPPGTVPDPSPAMPGIRVHCPWQ